MLVRALREPSLTRKRSEVQILQRPPRKAMPEARRIVLRLDSGRRVGSSRSIRPTIGGCSPGAATTRPERQPGARPPCGGWILLASIPAFVSNHDVTEFEFHISPV